MGIRITDEVSMISKDPFAVLRKLDRVAAGFLSTNLRL